MLTIATHMAPVLQGSKDCRCETFFEFSGADELICDSDEELQEQNGVIQIVEDSIDRLTELPLSCQIEVGACDGSAYIEVDVCLYRESLVGRVRQILTETLRIAQGFALIYSESDFCIMLRQTIKFFIYPMVQN